MYGHLAPACRLSSRGRRAIGRGASGLVPDRVIAYRTLADATRTENRDGRYAGGRKLPTEEQLSASYSVSRQTVRRAMQDLVSEGMIYRIAGRGTYPVAEEDRYVRQFGSGEELMALSIDTECEIVSPLQRRIDVENAGRLRLHPDELYARTLIRLHGSRRAVVRQCPAGVPAGAARAPRGPAVLRRGRESRRAGRELLRSRALLVPGAAAAQPRVASRQAREKSRTGGGGPEGNAPHPLGNKALGRSVCPGRCAGWSDRADLLGLRALLALACGVLDSLVVREAAVAVRLNGRVVNEDIGRAVVRGDETEALVRVEPLHCALSHLLSPTATVFGSTVVASRAAATVCPIALGSM